MKSNLESERQKRFRKKAEAALMESKTSPLPTNTQDALHLLHELQVHQIELEMQNEESQRAQQEAAASAVKYLELYDFAPVGYFTLSRDLRILQLNFAGARMLQKTRSTLIGAEFLFFIHEEQKAAFIQFMHDLYNCEVNTSLDSVMIIDNLPPIYVQFSATLTENGSQCLLTVLDISQRIHDAAVLQDTITREMKSLAEKDILFSVIAHDLRGPMNGLLGLTQILATESKNLSTEEIIEYSTEMHNAVQNLYKLMENLLEWSVFQRGLTSFTQVNLNLYNVTQECIDAVAARAQLKSITIYNEIKPDQMVFADEKMLMTIFRNIITNAIKFTRRLGTITIGSRLLESGMLKVSVTDTGVGIAQENIAKLFTIGARTGRTGTEDEPSTGLGLILCKEFTEIHGGKIWVESNPENLEAGIAGSSTFYFTLPIEEHIK